MYQKLLVTDFMVLDQMEIVELYLHQLLRLSLLSFCYVC